MTSAQESTADTMTSKTQGFRKRRTGPHLLNRRLARSGLSWSQLMGLRQSGGSRL